MWCSVHFALVCTEARTKTQSMAKSNFYKPCFQHSVIWKVTSFQWNDVSLEMTSKRSDIECVSTQNIHTRTRTHAGKRSTGALLGFSVGRAARQIYDAASQRACSLLHSYFSSLNSISFNSISFTNAFHFISVIH